MSCTATDRPIDAACATWAGWPRRVLVATHGAPSADPAVEAARALTSDGERSLQLLTVHTPDAWSRDFPRHAALAHGERSERLAAAALLRNVRRQRRRLLVVRRQWPLHVEVGEVPWTIARTAREIRADLVTLGIGSERPMDRQRGNATAMRVVQLVDVPLLAALDGGDVPAERAVLALPDGVMDAWTLHAALACTRSGGELWILRPAEAIATWLDDGWSAGIGTSDAAAARDASWRAHVSARESTTDEDILTGALDLAADVRARLIVTPVRGPAGVFRSLLPNIAAPLLLTARCSVLAVPDATGDARLSSPTAATTTTGMVGVDRATAPHWHEESYE